MIKQIFSNTHRAVVRVTFVVLSVLSVCFLMSLSPAWASSPININPFPLTGAFSAKHVEDRDLIAVMDFSGNYNRNLTEAELNVEARSVVAKEFYRTHPDQYDFIVVFTTFEFDTGDALAYYMGIKNDVEGIGMPLFDYSSLFGSNGKLQGYIDMAAFSRYELDPIRPGFDTVLQVLSHEVMHRWGARVKYKDNNGEISDALLGKDNVHWSYLLDSDASVMYGSDWRDNKDGSFTATMTRKFFSPLDLYLMGLNRADQVPPLSLIKNPEVDKNQFPILNATETGTVETVTIDQIIAAEGERIPNAENSQKTFRVGFVLLKGADQEVNERIITGLKNVRREFSTRFAAMTGGRAVLNIFPEAIPEVKTGGQQEVVGGELRENAANVSEAIVWLISQQKGDGYWNDNDSTRLRDTTVSLQHLLDLHGNFAGADSAFDWVKSATYEENTDYLARKLILLSRNGFDTAQTKTKLLALRNTDGGWGLSKGLDSDPFDTALALQALYSVANVNVTVLNQAIQYLQALKNADGGWGSSDQGASRINVTTEVLKALLQVGTDKAQVVDSISWLVSRQNADGSFGSNGGSVLETVLVLDTLIDYDSVEQIDKAAAITYVGERQDIHGSWNGSVYTTSLAAKTFKRFENPNLTIVFTDVDPISPFDGQRVNISLHITNNGNSLAGASVVRLYDGDPANGGTQIGSDINLSVMQPGNDVTVPLVWETFDLEGEHQLFAVVDPENSVDELFEYDNQVKKTVIVTPAPAQADLIISADEVVVSPANPDTLPAPLGFIVTLRNAGRTDAENVKVVLYSGNYVLEQQIVTVAQRSSTAVNLSHVITKAGVHKFSIKVDPDNTVMEADEANNSAVVSVSTIDTFDLEVKLEDISVVNSQLYEGGDITFSVMISNRGTVAIPVSEIKYSIFDGSSTDEIATQPLSLEAGESVQREMVWRATKSGNLNLVVELDALQQVPESNETNNSVSYPFTVGAVTGANLVVSHQDLTFNPDPANEGYGVTLNAMIRNTGAAEATGVEVNFYDGDPENGGVAIGDTVIIPSLSGGESVTLNHIWPEIPNNSDHLVFVVVDKNNTIAEFSETDNKTFNLLTVKSLPDLVINDGDVVISPLYPKPGDQVDIRVNIKNNGQQAATGVVVRAYNGIPEQGGVQVGSDKVVDLGAFEQHQLDFGEITADSQRDINWIVITIDPENAVFEKSEENNTGRRSFSSQNADINVTEPYISPNGDGVKDTTTLSYRFSTTEPLQLQIIGDSDNTVRTENLGNETYGQFIWDGLDRQGRVVPDGSYRLVISNKSSSRIFGEVAVIVDNNRSLLIDALGTEYQHVTNLTCDLRYSIDNIFIDESELWIYYKYQRDIYRMHLDGTSRELVVAADLSGLDSIADVSADGKQILYSKEGADGYIDLWVINGDGTNQVKILDGERNLIVSTSHLGLTEFSADGSKVYVSCSDLNGDRSKLVFQEIPVNAPENFSYVDLIGDGESYVFEFSPDRKKLLYHGSNATEENPSPEWSQNWFIMDLDTKESTAFAGKPEWQQITLGYPIYPFNAVSWGMLPHYATGLEGGVATSWSHDSRYVVFKDYSDISEQVLGIFGPYSYLTVYDTSGDKVWSISQYELLGITPVAGEVIDGYFYDISWTDTGKLIFSYAPSGYKIKAGMFLLNKIISEDIKPDSGGIYIADIERGTIEKIATLSNDTYNPIGFASYHISTWDGSEWVKRGELHFDKNHSAQLLSLEKYLPDADGEYRVRIRQTGHELSSIEAVALTGSTRSVKPSSAVMLETGKDVLEPILAFDHNPLQLHESEIEVQWQGVSSAAALNLRLIARELTLSDKQTASLRYPEQIGNYYSYQITNSGKLLIDGSQTGGDQIGAPLFAEKKYPITGHPFATVYGYMTSDTENLYAAVDLTVDNTFDSDIDKGTLYVKTATGEHGFNVSANNSGYGSIGFGETSKVAYPHVYIEFKIPLAEIGATIGDVIDVRFETTGSAVILDQNNIVEGGEQTAQLDEPVLYGIGFLDAIPNSNAVMYYPMRYWMYDGYERVLINLGRDNKQKTVLSGYYFDPSHSSRFRRKADFSRFTPSGSGLYFYGTTMDGELRNGCENYSGFYAATSILNLTVDLRALRTYGKGGVQLFGTVADSNLDYYTIEYSNQQSPDAWYSVQSPSSDSVVDELLTTWIPPEIGQYLVKLTAYDRSGNKRSKIVKVDWREITAITSLKLEPEYVSPNGDGIQDAVTMSYRVNTPMHVQINIYNAEHGFLVRQLERDHSVIGEISNVEWDGRDNSGLVVPDGLYRIEIQDYELFVTIDNTFPEVTFMSNDPFAEMDKGTTVEIEVDPFLDISAKDINGNFIKLQYQLYKAQSNDWSDAELKEVTSVNEFEDFKRKIYLDYRPFPYQTRWRLEVHDKAGNVSLATTDFFPERLALHSVFSRHPSSDNLICPERNDNKWIVIPEYANLADINLGVAETLNEPLEFAEVQYRDVNRDNPQPGDPWISKSIYTLNNQNADTRCNEPDAIIDVSLGDRWNAKVDLSSLERGKFYEVRIHAINTKGENVFSNSTKIYSNDVLYVKRYFNKDVYEDKETNRIKTNHPVIEGVTGGSSLTQVQLILSSKDDSRYLTPKTFGVITNPENFFYFDAEGLKACSTYNAYLVGINSQFSYKSPNKTFKTSCISLGVYQPEPVKIEDMTCGQNGDQIKLRFSTSVHRNSKLSSLIVRDEQERVLLSRVSHDEIVKNASFIIEKFLLQPGVNNLKATLRSADGEEVTRSFRVLIDNNPAQLEINYPRNGIQKVCGLPFDFEQINYAGKKNTVVRSAVQIKGDMNDDAISILETIKSDYNTSFSRSPYVIESFSAQWRPKGEEEWREVNQKIQGVREPAIVGENLTFGYIHSYSGEIDLSVSAVGYDNSKQCKTISFEMDTIVEGADFSAASGLISPKNRDGQLDSAILHMEADEPVNIDLIVKDESGAVIRSLVNKMYLAGGTTEYVWDGKTDSGEFASDGLYVITAIFTDGCNIVEEHDIEIEIDNTPPDLAITGPGTTGPYPIMVDIVGSVHDSRLQSYSVSYGVGTTPATWALIGAGVDNKADELLTSWSTFGFKGDYQLKLEALDAAYNKSEVLVNLNFQERNEWISSLDATPVLFSPNDDKELDITAIEFSLVNDLVVNLEVRDLNNQVVRTIEQNATLSQGVYVRNWDGKTDADHIAPDGIYNATISAHLAGEPENVQEEKTTVVVDTEPPTLTITTPNSEGFIDSSQSITGTIEDEHLSQYTIYYTDTPSAPDWKKIASGKENLVNVDLINIEGYADGAYKLKIDAVDLAENQAELIVPFSVDSVVPEVAWLEPKSAALLGAVNGQVSLKAAIVEENLESYVVEYGVGNDPQDWSVIVSGNSNSTDNALGAWTIDTVNDGEYTLRIIVTDKVGHTAEARTGVIIDNTPPQAQFASLADNDYIGGATDIIGTVTDSHLLEYDLAVAPGAKGESERWSLIGKAQLPVSNDVLWNWQLLPVDGLYTLRLLATDAVGNKTEQLLQISVDSVPLGQVDGLVANVVQSGILGDVNLTWNPLTVSDLAGYAIYRNGIRVNDSLHKIAGFTDAGLPQGEYQYQVSAFDLAGNESEKSEVLILDVDYVPPQVAIHSPVVNSVVREQINISGTAKGTDDFKEYRVYVGEGETPSNWQLINRSTVPVINSNLAQWSTFGLTEGTKYTIKLEAEDIRGNQAEISVPVIIDNLPPAAPTGVVAVANQNTVTLSWDVNPEEDLLGYIIFRNEHIVNADSGVIGDLEPYAIIDPTYQDAELPDNRYSYGVAAIDKAGNLSVLSEPVEVLIDIRAPQAKIVTPENSTKFDQPLYIKAVCEDDDVANVLFQYKPDGETNWIDIESADYYPPYEVNWNIEGLNYGQFQLRAVATDQLGKIDADPDEITVIYKDVTAPAVPTGVSISVDGGNVHLNWSANSESDLAGYHIFRRAENGTLVQITASPLDQPEYTDSDLEDNYYYYIVRAVDNNENFSAVPAQELRAHVYTPDVKHPYTPRLDGVIEVEGTVEAISTVTITHTKPEGEISTLSSFSDSEGWFLVEGLIPELGENIVEVKVEDYLGNTSKVKRMIVIMGARPTPPTGLSATVNGYDVGLDWDDHTDSTVIGYRVFREGLSVLPDTIPVIGLTATSRDQSGNPEGAIDGNTTNGWTLNKEPSVEGQWLEITAQEKQLLSRFVINWYNENDKAADYDIQAFDGNAWITLYQVRGSLEQVDEIQLNEPYYAQNIRILLREIAPDALGVGLMEVELFAIPLQTTSELPDTVQDGTYQYYVTAVNNLGFESVPGEIINVEVGDVVAPDPVTLSASVFGSDVQLSWSASSASDLDYYEIFRNGVEMAKVDAGIETYTDTVANGVYNYTIKVVDQVGNISAASNSVEVTVLVAIPASPGELTVTVVPEGEALDLSWQAQALAPGGYRLYRSFVSGGPYQIVAETEQHNWKDTGLENGKTCFYVVVALDLVGNESATSNEVSATPQDMEPPAVPVLVAPGAFGESVIVESRLVDLQGVSDPGSQVLLMKDGVEVGRRITDEYTSVDQTTLSVNLDESYGSGVGISASGRYLLLNEYGYSSVKIYDYATQTYLDIPGVYETALIEQIKNSDDLLMFIQNGMVRYKPDQNSFDVIIGYAEFQDYPTWADMDETGQFMVMYTMHDSVKGIWQFNSDSQEWKLLLDVQNVIGKPAATSDLTWIAFAQEDNNGLGLTLLNTENGTIRRVIDSGIASSGVAWSHDGKQVIYSSSELGASVLKRYDLDSEQLETVVTDVSVGWMTVGWSPDGKEIIYTDSQQKLIRKNLSEDSVEVILDSGELPRSYHWSSTNRIVVSRGSEAYWFALPGGFEFENIDLNAGDNLFTAVAIDTTGNTSPVTAPLNVILSSAKYPDLAISDTDIKILPAAPITGESTRVGVTVHNAGGVTSDQTTVSISVIGEDGLSYAIAESTPVPQIVAGAAHTLTFDWQAPDSGGNYLFVAVVDQFDQIVEQSESNNMAVHEVLVTGQRGVSLDAVLTKELIEANDQLDGSVNLTNNGEMFNGYLTVKLEDVDGYEVLTLINQPVSELGYGESVVHDIAWNSGNTFAGNYQLHATVFDADGILLNESVKPFAINGQIQIEANISTDKKYYRSNQVVKVTGNMAYIFGNQILDGTEVTLQVLGANDEVLLEEKTTLGSLLPSAQNNLALTWNTGFEAIGVYHANIIIEYAGNIIVTKKVSFDIIPGAPQIKGSLELSDVIPAAGSEFKAQFVIHNEGNVNLMGLPVILTLIDPSTQEELSVQESSVDIAVNSLVEGEFDVSTANLSLKTYGLTSHTQIEDEQGVLQTVILGTKFFTVVDRQVPDLSFVKPVANSVNRSDVQVVVKAADALSGIKTVELKVDNSDWQTLTVYNVNQSTYGVVLNGLSAGEHSLEAKATDNSDNTIALVKLSFIVDNVAPAISVSGITDNGYYNTACSPVIDISDSNLATSTIQLNGKPYSSGTPISAEGGYNLAVYAVDLAGNEATYQAWFFIDKTAPVIVIYGVEDGLTYNKSVQAFIEVTENNLEQTLVTLNGADYESGTVISEDNNYELIVSVVDRAENTATTTLNFIVDTTPPNAPTILEPTDGEVIDTLSTKVTGTTESNALVSISVGDYQTTTIATADGQFSFNDVILIEGENTITVFATDTAGNKSDQAQITVTARTVGEVNIDALINTNSGARVLVFVPEDKNHHCCCNTHSNGCSCCNNCKHCDENSGLAELLDSMLSENDIDHLIVSDEHGFITALRSQRYNQVIIADIDESRIKLSYSTELELRANVASGTGLVVIASRPLTEKIWQEIFGVRNRGINPKLEYIDLDPSPASDDGNHYVSGNATKLRVTDGIAVGELHFSKGNGHGLEGYPAMVLNTFGKGPAAIMPFNPINIADQESAKDILMDVIRFATPTQGNLIPGGMTMINWQLGGLPVESIVRFEETVTAPLSLVWLGNNGNQLDSVSATWEFTVNQEEMSLQSLVKLPEESGNYTATGKVYLIGDGNPQLLGEKQLGLVVSYDWQTLGALLMDALNNMDVGNRRDERNRQDVMIYVQYALSRAQNTPRDVMYSIDMLLNAEITLSKMNNDHIDILVILGDLLRTYQVNAQ